LLTRGRISSRFGRFRRFWRLRRRRKRIVGHLLSPAPSARSSPRSGLALSQAGRPGPSFAALRYPSGDLGGFRFSGVAGCRRTSLGHCRIAVSRISTKRFVFFGWFMWIYGLRSPAGRTSASSFSGGRRLWPTGVMSAFDAVDGCAGRPAEGRRCKSVTVKA
jgi:hypothetical protein